MRIRVAAVCGKGIFAGEDSAGNYCVFDQMDTGPALKLNDQLVGAFEGESERLFDAKNSTTQGNVTLLLQKWKCTRAEAWDELEKFAKASEIRTL